MTFLNVNEKEMQIFIAILYLFSKDFLSLELFFISVHSASGKTNFYFYYKNLHFKRTDQMMCGCMSIKESQR